MNTSPLSRIRPLRNSLSFASVKRVFQKKPFIIVAALIVLSLGILAIRMMTQKTTASTKVDIQGPTATVDVNKEYSFPVNDDKGKELTRIKYTVEKAELRNEIIVKGQKATVVNGKTFLILSIKLVNDYNKGLEIHARDYIRISVNGQEAELLAADIHNDPITIQPISTKYTRIGFPINDTDKDIVMHVGEINAEKEKTPLSFTIAQK